MFSDNLLNENAFKIIIKREVCRCCCLKFYIYLAKNNNNQIIYGKPIDLITHIYIIIWFDWFAQSSLSSSRWSIQIYIYIDDDIDDDDDVDRR